MAWASVRCESRAPASRLVASRRAVEQRYPAHVTEPLVI